jgi:hypothetical protein
MIFTTTIGAALFGAALFLLPVGFLLAGLLFFTGHWVLSILAVLATLIED